MEAPFQPFTRKKSPTMTTLPTAAAPNRNELIDRFNRRLSYLRVSITDRCGLNCIYCSPERSVPKLSHDDILRYEEILRIVHVGVQLGIRKIRVTGGEPLVRKGVCGFLQQLSADQRIEDLSLTTNGVLLKQYAKKIQTAGVRRLNISLDTLSAKKYRDITGHDLFFRVWDGILAAHQLGFSPIKINVVALRGINEDSLLPMARLTYEYPFHIRFIEHMPMASSSRKTGRPLLTPEIKKRIEQLGTLFPVEGREQDGPARRFRFADALGEIGFISPLSHHFCSSCNRLRLTSDGKLRVCLLSDYQQDLKTPLRSGCSDPELADIILEAISHKPLDHGISPRSSAAVRARMSSIGG